MDILYRALDRAERERTAMRRAGGGPSPERARRDEAGGLTWAAVTGVAAGFGFVTALGLGILTSRPEASVGTDEAQIAHRSDPPVRPAPPRFDADALRIDAVPQRAALARQAPPPDPAVGSRDILAEAARNPEILLALARAFVEAGDTDRAHRAFTRALAEGAAPEALLPPWLPLHERLPVATAIASLEALSQAFPRNPDIAAQLGFAHSRQGSMAEAARAFEWAASLAPTNPVHQYNAGGALDRLGRGAEARAYYERALVLVGRDTGGIPVGLIRSRLAEMPG